MANIHDIFKEDDTSGVIIGGEFTLGRLYYDGRPQGKQIYAINAERLVEDGRKLKHDILKDCGEAARYIYPDDTKWVIKILN